MSSSENQYGQGKSHAAGDSAVPPKLQEKLPKSVEDQAPESLHPTGSDKGRSHATGKSIVPQKIQDQFFQSFLPACTHIHTQAVPEGLERALPDAIHDTSGLPPKKK